MPKTLSSVLASPVTARSPLDLTANPGSSENGALAALRDNTNTPHVPTNLTTSFQTVLDLTGPGEVNLLVAGAWETTWEEAGFWRVTIDGVVWIDGTVNMLDSGDDNRINSMIGYVHYDAGTGILNIGFEPVPFAKSFKVEAKRGGTGTSWGYTFYSYTLR